MSIRGAGVVACMGVPDSSVRNGAVARAVHGFVSCLRGKSSGGFARIYSRNIGSDTGNGSRGLRSTIGRAVTTTSDGLSSAGATSSARPRICIVGGGFGGLYTALRLEGLSWPEGKRPEVTLVDKSDRFVFKPLLYELLTGAADADEVSPKFSDLLEPTSVQFVCQRVERVEHEADASPGPGSRAGCVVLSDGSEIDYDWIVLALGADITPRGTPGAKEHAIPFATLEDVERAIAELDSIKAKASQGSIAVVGTGYSGVELAAALAERMKGSARVSLVGPEDRILPAAPDLQRAEASRYLERSGVEIVTSTLATKLSRPVEGGPVQVTLSPRGDSGGPSTRDFDVVFWTAGSVPASSPADRFSAPPPARFPFATDARGATETDAMLRVRHSRRAFAIGDIATAGAARLPATAQVAFQQADYAAWNLWASINGRPLLPFRYQHLGEMMSLGKESGSVALPLPVPAELADAVNGSPLGPLLGMAGVTIGAPKGGFAPSGVNLGGPLGAALRRAAYWYRQPTDGQRVKVGQSWVQQAVSAAIGQASKAERR